MKLELKESCSDGSIKRSQVEAGQAFALAPTPDGSIKRSQVEAGQAFALAPTPDGSIPRSKVAAGQAFALAPTPNDNNGVLMVAVFNADPQFTHLAGPGGCCPSVNLSTGGVRWINGSTAVWLQDAAVVVQVKK